MFAQILKVYVSISVVTMAWVKKSMTIPSVSKAVVLCSEVQYLAFQQQLLGFTKVLGWALVSFFRPRLVFVACCRVLASVSWFHIQPLSCLTSAPPSLSIVGLCCFSSCQRW